MEIKVNADRIVSESFMDGNIIDRSTFENLEICLSLTPNELIEIINSDYSKDEKMSESNYLEKMQNTQDVKNSDIDIKMYDVKLTYNEREIINMIISNRGLCYDIEHCPQIIKFVRMDKVSKWGNEIIATFMIQNEDLSYTLCVKNNKLQFLEKVHPTNDNIIPILEF